MGTDPKADSHRARAINATGVLSGEQCFATLWDCYLPYLVSLVMGFGLEQGRILRDFGVAIGGVRF